MTAKTAKKTAKKVPAKKAAAKPAAKKTSPKPRAPRKSAEAKAKASEEPTPKVEVAEGVAVEPHQSVRDVGALHSPSGAALNPLFHD